MFLCRQLVVYTSEKTVAWVRYYQALSRRPLHNKHDENNYLCTDYNDRNNYLAYAVRNRYQVD